MLSHSLFGFGLCVAVLFAALPAAAGPVSTLPPDQAVALALSAHPDLHAAEAAYETARARRNAASVLSANPTATGWSTPNAERAEVSVTQPLSVTGAGWSVRRSARAEMDGADASLSRRRREVAAAVRLAYAEAVVARGIVGVATDGTELAARLLYAVRRKHEEGEASSLELRLARLSEVSAATRLLEARRIETQAVRVLASWVSTPVDPEQLVDDPLVVAPAASSTTAPRSDRLAADAAVEQARATLRAARANAMPPVVVGARWALEDGQSFIGPSVGVTLPVFARNQRQRAQANGQLAVAESNRDQLDAVIATEQRTAAFRVTEARTAAERVENADLDEARSALASIEAGVLAGEIDLSTAVLLQSQVLDGEAAIVRLRGLVADAEIDWLLAMDDDALLGNPL